MRPARGRTNGCAESRQASDTLGCVSFDVFFQGFIAGEASESGGAQMREVLMPYVVDENGSSLRVRIGDGEASVYLDDAGMMANHVSGSDPWNLLVEGAQAANWVIMPVGCPTCLTQPGQREELPDDLPGDVVVIQTGADLQALIERS